MNEPKCFISYSHETAEHKDWVRDLATRLTENKVSVFLDQWDLKYGHDLPKYMETSIRESDFVLLICTPIFAEKANIGKGGVGYEKTIVTGEIYQNVCSPSKFVPIIRRGNDEESLPSYLKGKMYADFRDDLKFNEAFEDLLRHLYDKPKYTKPNVNEVSLSSSSIVIFNDNKSNNLSVNIPNVKVNAIETSIVSGIPGMPETIKSSHYIKIGIENHDDKPVFLKYPQIKLRNSENAIHIIYDDFSQRKVEIGKLEPGDSFDIYMNPEKYIDYLDDLDFVMIPDKIGREFTVPPKELITSITKWKDLIGQ